MEHTTPGGLGLACACIALIAAGLCALALAAKRVAGAPAQRR